MGYPEEQSASFTSTFIFGEHSSRCQRQVVEKGAARDHTKAPLRKHWKTLVTVFTLLAWQLQHLRAKANSMTGNTGYSIRVVNLYHV